MLTNDDILEWLADQIEDTYPDAVCSFRMINNYFLSSTKAVCGRSVKFGYTVPADLGWYEGELLIFYLHDDLIRVTIGHDRIPEEKQGSLAFLLGSEADVDRFIEFVGFVRSYNAQQGYYD